ncbi:hypothetical protein LPJ73_002202, partial [Coemansia sp. RSA 2703]
MLFQTRRFSEAAQLGSQYATHIGATGGRTVLAALARLQEQELGKWTGSRRAFDWEEFERVHSCSVRRAACIVIDALDRRGLTDAGHVCALLAIDLAWAQGARLPRVQAAWWFSGFSARGLTPGPAAYALVARAYERSGDREWARRLRDQQGGDESHAWIVERPVDEIICKVMAEPLDAARQRLVARVVARLADVGRIDDARSVWAAGDPGGANYRAIGRLALAASHFNPFEGVALFAAACRAARGGTRTPAFASLFAGILRAALDAPLPDTRRLSLAVCALAEQNGALVNAQVFGLLLARLPVDDRGVYLALRLAVKMEREGVVPDDMS